MLVPYLYFLIGWLFFGAIHSLTAASWFKQHVAQRIGNGYRYYRLLYNAVSMITFVPILLIYRMLPVHYLIDWLGNRWLGWSLELIGLLVALLAFRQYDLATFVGIPSQNPNLASTNLEQGGLLRFTRHPLYLGMLLFLMGLVLSQPTWATLALLIFSTIYIRIGIYFEEKKLVSEFGDRYRQYQKQVPMLIPGLYVR